MRGRTLFALFISVMAVTCSASRPLRTASPAPPGASVPSERAAFDEKIRPILARTCAPCHNPGGKMYARLPFDDPEVVASHQEGVLRRLKGPDQGAVEEWLKTRKTAP